MLSSPRFRFSAAFVAALLCSAACAQAATVSDYRVDTQLSATYEHHIVEPGGTGDFKSTFAISTTYPKVSFSDGGLVTSVGGATTISGVVSSAHLVAHTPQGDVSADCAGSTAQPVSGPTVSSSVLTPLDGGALLTVKPFSEITLLWTCTGPSSFPSGLPLPNVPAASGEGPFDVVFSLPPDASTMGKVIQLVDKDVALDTCPLHSGYSTSCTLHLQGQVTFTRTGQSVVQPPASDGDLLTPLGPKPKPDDLLTPLISTRAKLAADGSRTTFTFTCGAGCTLTAHVYGGGGRLRAAAAARPLATKRITLAHGGTRRVTIRFGKAARRAIKRAGGARLELVAKPIGGGAAVKRTLALKLARRQ
jgi:hypothetical protein